MGAAEQDGPVGVTPSASPSTTSGLSGPPATDEDCDPWADYYTQQQLPQQDSGRQDGGWWTPPSADRWDGGSYGWSWAQRWDDRRPSWTTTGDDRWPTCGQHPGRACTTASGMVPGAGRCARPGDRDKERPSEKLHVPEFDGEGSNENRTSEGCKCGSAVLGCHSGSRALPCIPCLGLRGGVGHGHPRQRPRR